MYFFGLKGKISFSSIFLPSSCFWVIIILSFLYSKHHNLSYSTILTQIKSVEIYNLIPSPKEPNRQQVWMDMNTSKSIGKLRKVHSKQRDNSLLYFGKRKSEKFLMSIEVTKGEASFWRWNKFLWFRKRLVEWELIQGLIYLY